jgi:hypothetical protein
MRLGEKPNPPPDGDLPFVFFPPRIVENFFSKSSKS